MTDSQISDWMTPWMTPPDDPVKVDTNPFDFDHPSIFVDNIFGGVSYRFRFDNGMTVSVIRHTFSYGYKNNLWELALIQDSTGGFVKIQGDPVTGNLTEENVNSMLVSISSLEPDS